MVYGASSVFIRGKLHTVAYNSVSASILCILFELVLVMRQSEIVSEEDEWPAALTLQSSDSNSIITSGRLLLLTVAIVAKQRTTPARIARMFCHVVIVLIAANSTMHASLTAPQTLLPRDESPRRRAISSCHFVVFFALTDHCSPITARPGPALPSPACRPRRHGSHLHSTPWNRGSMRPWSGAAGPVSCRLTSC